MRCCLEAPTTCCRPSTRSSTPHTSRTTSIRSRRSASRTWRRPPAGSRSGREWPGAQDSVVKVLGTASSCARNLEGSGFVFAAERVMTNAHVVAGVRAPTVTVGEGVYEAEVVYYDSDIDVAVLAVPGLDVRALRFDGSAESGEAAAVLGFPENGPYDVQPARVRDRQSLRSPDIYGDGTVVRDTYSLFSRVRQGNSGGPLVDRQGEVIGVIFAASVTDADTGYALAADQVADAARISTSSHEPVSTGDCAV
ncbi:MAG: MarP family serine protease [Nocardioidaceae bacterium]